MRSWVSIRSESTRAFGHPSEIKPTLFFSGINKPSQIAKKVETQVKSKATLLSLGRDYSGD
tara:strand:+ start:29 stop:211 length:183 start_codon:yes stop_codon:yes gene_type:complete